MKHIKPLPSLETLNKYLNYNSETGILSWKSGLTYQKQRPEGAAAGTMSKGGYLRTTIERRMYSNNRIAWKMHYGTDPEGIIDHRDGVKTNDRILNLRDTTQNRNLENRVVGKNSTTGIKGVVFEPRRGTYRVNLKAGGVRLGSPSFATPEAANDYLVKIRAELHGEFTCHGERRAA